MTATPRPATLRLPASLRCQSRVGAVRLFLQGPKGAELWVPSAQEQWMPVPEGGPSVRGWWPCVVCGRGDAPCKAAGLILVGHDVATAPLPTASGACGPSRSPPTLKQRAPHSEELPAEYVPHLYSDWFS